MSRSTRPPPCVSPGGSSSSASRRGAALATAALFAVFTIHVEAVTSLVGRAEILAAVLVLAVARLWLRATEGEGVRPGPYAAAPRALSRFRLREGERDRRAGRRPPRGAVPWRARPDAARSFRGPSRAPARWALLGFLGPIAVLFAVRVAVIHGFLVSREAGIFDLENPLVSMAPALRVANALDLALRYAWKTFLPVHLSADHSAYALALATGLREPRAWTGPAFALVLAAAALAFWRRRPLAALGVSFFAGSLFPVSNVPFVIGTI